MAKSLIEVEGKIVSIHQVRVRAFVVESGGKFHSVMEIAGKDKIVWSFKTKEEAEEVTDRVNAWIDSCLGKN